MPNIKVPTIPNYPPQGIQAQLDLMYLWNPDVANGLIDQINKALEDLDKDLSMYLTKAEAAATYATQTEVTQLSGAIEEVSNKADTLENDLKELGDQTTSIQQDVNTLKTDVSTLQTDVDTLQTDVGALQTDVDALQTDVDTLQTDVAGKVSKAGDTMTGALTLRSDSDPLKPALVINKYKLFLNGFELNCYFNDSNRVFSYNQIGGFYVQQLSRPAGTNNCFIGSEEFPWHKIYTEKLSNGADITVPAVGGTLTLNEVNFKTAITDTNKGLTEADAYTKEEVDAKVSSVYRFRGSVATYNDLPTEGNVLGDVWNIEDTGANYAWDGTKWDKLSETVDLTPYLTKEDAASTYATIATVNGKQDALAPDQLAAVNSGITADHVASYDAYAGEISAAQSTADKADGAAEVAQQTANLAGQTAAQALSGLAGKVNLAQGVDNAGKVMTVGEDGNLAPADIPSATITTDATLTGAGTPDSPLGVGQSVKDSIDGKVSKTGDTMTGQLSFVDGTAGTQGFSIVVDGDGIDAKMTIYFDYNTSFGYRFDPSNFYPTFGENCDLGTSVYPWGTVYTKTISADDGSTTIIIPAKAGTMALLSDVADLGNQVTEIQSSVNTLNASINNKADKATDFETPITNTNKGATMKEIEEVKTSSIKFKGYVSTTQPASDAYLLVDGNMWINAATMPSSFPVPASSIRVWDGSAWQTTTESYTPDALDAWSNLDNNEGYYWFGAWKVFSTDLSTEYFTLNQTSGLWEIKQSIHLPGTPTVDTPDGTNLQAIVNVDYVNTMETMGNKITNCVLQIPQNLNLELNNGTLTLKAGSKTYMPRAGGGFDELVTTNDITYSHPNDGEYLVFIESQGRWVSIMQTEYCFSGTTEPEKTGYKVWYDTGTNIINYYNADNVTSKQSFPIAKVTVSGGQISSIDAVFNGFGFVGSSVFSFPGLKVAVPNGRNPDGTLNNSTDSQTQVLTTNLTTAPRTKLWANAKGIIAVNDETTSDYGYTYDERLNIVYTKNNMQRRNYAHIADLVLNPDDNLHIIDINPKYPMRATDYWDFNKLVKEVDNVAKEVDNVAKEVGNVAKLDAPNKFTSTNNSFANQILIRQDNGFAPVNVGYNSDGTQFSIHSVLSTGWGASVGVDADGTYCSTPTPDSNGDNITNTAWVRDLIASKAKIEGDVFIENLGTNIVRISGTESFGVLAQQDATEIHPIALPVKLANANYVVQTTATSADGMCEILSSFSARTATGFNISVRNLATAAEATDVAVCWSIIGQKV